MTCTFTAPRRESATASPNSFSYPLPPYGTAVVPLLRDGIFPIPSSVHFRRLFPLSISTFPLSMDRFRLPLLRRPFSCPPASFSLSSLLTQHVRCRYNNRKLVLTNHCVKEVFCHVRRNDFNGCHLCHTGRHLYFSVKKYRKKLTSGCVR